MVDNFLSKNGISYIFCDPKEITIFNIFISHDSNPCTIIISEDYPNLVIEVVLTSSFLLIPSPHSDLGLQTSSQVTKEVT